MLALAVLCIALIPVPGKAQVAYPFNDCNGGPRPVTFGEVADYALVVLNNLNTFSDSQRAVAVGGLNGGTATLTGYGIGTNIDKSSALAAGFHTLVVDTDLTWNQGNIQAGYGVYTGTGTITSVGTAGGGTLTRVGTSPIDFVSVESMLRYISANLFILPQTSGATVTNPFSGGLQFNYAGNEPVVIFNISAADVNGKTTYIYNITSNPKPIVIVNVADGPSTMQWAGTTLNGMPPQHILWNFNGDLTLNGFSFQGSILGSEITLTFPSGNVEGQTFVRNLVGVQYASGETHLVPFCGDLSKLPGLENLPVELIGFDAVVDGEHVILRWQTASETNNAGFEMQHLSRTETSPGEWQVLDFIEGAGTTATMQNYSFRTQALTTGTHTFRLRQVDYDGAFEYSPEVEVYVGMQDLYRVEKPYPNPFHGAAQLRFSVARTQSVQVMVYDLLGRRVDTLFDGIASSGQVHHVAVDGARLSSGLYMVQVRGTDFVETYPITHLE